MRILPCSLIACTLLIGATSLFAQEKTSPFEDYDVPPIAKGTKSPTRRVPRLGISSGLTGQLIQQRAMMQAQQRRARIEIRKWQGKSLLRPDMKTLRPPLVDSYGYGGYDWYWGNSAPRYQFHWGY